MSKGTLRSHCPVNFGLEAFGDKWSLLILRDIVFRGKKTYNEFLASEEGFATNILSARLAHLEEEGILRKRQDPDDRRKGLYVLTEKGLDLIPLLFEFMLWSAKYDSKSHAHKVPGLLEEIQKRNRKTNKTAIAQVRQGRSVLADYLDHYK